MSFTKDQIIEAVSTMSVMDIVELIAAMEERFGVTATSFNATTSGGSNATNADSTATDVSEEKIEFDVVLKSVGSNKIAVIKAVRGVTSLGLKEAKDLVESAPTVLKESVSKNDAEAVKKSLEEAGAEVEIR